MTQSKKLTRFRVGKETRIVLWKTLSSLLKTLTHAKILKSGQSENASFKMNVQIL